MMNSEWRDRFLWGLICIGISSVVLIVTLGMIFLYAPREATMGDVQRIFYFHVASAWVGFFAFFVTFVAGIGYLWQGQRRWDVLALSSVEVGLTFIAMTVVTGALWARPVWGTYWVWDPRLTISAIQLLIYISYVMLRSSIENREQKARFAAVYGIAAFVTTPLSWLAIRWRRSIHPIILTSGAGMAMTPRMRHTLLASIAAFTLLYLSLMIQRIRIERTADVLARLRLEADIQINRG